MVEYPPVFRLVGFFYCLSSSRSFLEEAQQCRNLPLQCPVYFAPVAMTACRYMKA